jgi:glycosyltransferase involved in cell wall biosynthesis
MLSFQVGKSGERLAVILAQWLVLAGAAWLLVKLLALFSALARLQKASGPGFVLAASAASLPAAGSSIWVISAARNEIDSLPLWASSLRAQLLQGDRELKVILVDDGSNDGSLAWAKREALSWPALTVLSAESGGKTAALDLAIRHLIATGQSQDLVLFTDADCSPAAGWAQAHAEALEAGGGLIGAHIALELEDRAENRPRLLESALSTLQCALGSVTGHPAYMRGANWSTRLELLERSQGFAGNEDLPSGDDLLLPARLIRAGAIPGALLGRESWVHAKEDTDLVSRRESSRRRNAKWKLLPLAHRVSRTLNVLALCAFLLPILFPAVQAAWGPEWSLAGVGLAALALLLLRQGLALYEMQLRAEDPLHMLRLGWQALRGVFNGASYEWKGRKRDIPRA